jgi:cell wall assembly regulator SMI1
MSGLHRRLSGRSSKIILSGGIYSRGRTFQPNVARATRSARTLASVATLHELSTWMPALETLLRDAPAHVDLVEFSGTVGSGSSGGSHRMDGGSPPAGWHADFALFDALMEVAAQGNGRTVGVVLRASRSGRREADLIELPDSASYGVSDIVGDLILVDGALPALYRQQPGHASGGPTRPTAPSADPAALTRLVHQKLPAVDGATTAQLDAVEGRLGATLTDEVRALYLAAGRGELIVGGEDGEDGAGGFYGLELIPLDDDEARSWYLPPARMSEWQFGAKETLGPDPQRKVQPLGATPQWFPVGHDWGGNAYAVDLTPDGRGHRGQVVFLDHELNAGATFVAESFTELLVHGREGEPTGPVAGAHTAHVNDRNGTTVAAAAEDPDLEVVSLGLLDAPVDLTPLLDRPRIRTLDAPPGTLADPRQIDRLPGLEYLSRGLREWRTVLDGGSVPSGLLAARVAGRYGDDDLAAIVTTATEVLGRWGRPLIQVTRLR